MKNFITASTQQKEIPQAVVEIAGQLQGFSPRVVLFFASSHYDLQTLGSQLQSQYKTAAVFGCTTSGEIVSGKMLKQSVVAMGFSSQAITDAKIEIVEDIKNKNQVSQAFKGFDHYFKESMRTADPDRYFGICLIDGLSASEEKVIDKVGDLTNLTFLGGSAGDDLAFKSTQVFGNGKAYSNAAVLAILKSAVPFDVIKTQSFKILPKKLVATKVDEANRQVFEFNHKPAAIAYAEALGIDVKDAPNHFMHNPIGLVVDGQPFVRSPQQVKDSSIVFYCSVLNGMEYTLLESGDIVKDTQAALNAKRKEFGDFSAILNFHCILRTIELEQKKQTEAYGKLFTDVPTIGFSTYGEQYLGHINQTSTMLVFK